jgi:hypothetical protein
MPRPFRIRYGAGSSREGAAGGKIVDVLNGSSGRGRDAAAFGNTCGGLEGLRWALGRMRTRRSATHHAYTLPTTSRSAAGSRLLANEAVTEVPLLVTTEHSIIAGLGGGVAEILAEGAAKARILRIRLAATWGESAPNDFLLAKHRLSESAIAETGRAAP